MSEAVLPVAFWGCVAIQSVAADDAARIEKALTRRSSDLRPWLEAAGVTPVDVAAATGAPIADVERFLSEPVAPPAVMLDAEDAVAEADRADAVRGAATWLADPRWPDGTLRLVRLPTADPGWLPTLFEASTPPALDAIVLPKVEDPRIVASIADALAGTPTRLVHLIETPRGVATALELADAAGDRLAGLLFGAIDHAAILAIDPADEDHPATTWGRITVGNAAAAASVPGFDGMTVRYPVAPPGTDGATARQAILGGVGLAAQRARAADAVGLAGKLTGHPAQTLAVQLAFRGLDAARVPDRLAEVEAFAAALRDGRAVGVVDGRMVDAATDALARAQLRRAAARGALDADQASALGPIDRSPIPTPPPARSPA